MEQHRHIHKVIKGDGPCIILLHGLTGSSLNWGRLTRKLSPQYKTVAFDFVGHGKSDAPTDPSAYQLEAILKDIDCIVEEEGSGQAILCGLSMGAAAMLLYTLRYPNKVLGLILTSFPPGKSAPGISSFAVPFANLILKKGLSIAGETFVWGPDSPFSAADAELIKQGFLQHKHPHGLALCMKEFLANIPHQSDLLPLLSHVTQPTLLIAGEQDHPSLSYSEAIHKSLPEKSHQFFIIKKGGHLVNIDSYKRYNEIVIQFLEELTHD